MATRPAGTVSRAPLMGLVWMLARLYNERAEYHTPDILAACKSGVDFLRKYVKREDNRVYFCVSDDGEVGMPVSLSKCSR